MVLQTSLDSAVLQLMYVGQDDQFIKSMSEDERVHCRTFANPYLAAQWLERNPSPDGILVEVFGKGMNGFSFYEQIHQRFKLFSSPFILLDNCEECTTLKNKARQSGIDDFYHKTPDVGALVLRLQFLKQYKQEHDLARKLKQKKREVITPLWKRMVDILGASIAILLLSPILLLTMLAIRIESRGPLFYAAKRVGAGYAIFPFFKFRSMYVGADAKLKELEHLNQYGKEENDYKQAHADGEYASCSECEALGHPCSPILFIGDREVCERQYLLQKAKKQDNTFKKIKNDPRVTKVGRFIRKYSIDELPQLFNVIRGDMSLVGNRPIPLYEAEMLTSDKWTERFLAPAGLTGWWQVSRRGHANMSNEERRALDNYYAKHYSLWFDLKILLKTVTSFVQKEQV